MREVLLDRMEKKGVLRGREEGRLDNQIEAAKNMLKAGKHSDAEILSISGISAQKLAEIRSASEK
jgi:predicted transposase YdaD